MKKLLMIGVAALAGATSKEFYFGWHAKSDDPLENVMRIVVKTNVVEAAHAVAKSNPDYGAITITDFWVHDEPPLDSKSWIGWNLRTIGGGEDAEGRMYLPDVGSGLSAAVPAGVRSNTLPVSAPAALSLRGQAPARRRPRDRRDLRTHRRP